MRDLIRSVPDFPKPGILFRDITTLLRDGSGLRTAVEELAAIVSASGAVTVAGIEARGFIFGAAVAARLGLGFVPVRKPGKLPVPAISIDYTLEYGADRLEIDPGAIRQDEPLALIDDLIATGGTAMAAATLLKRAGSRIVQAAFVIDLPDLQGLRRLRGEGVPSSALVSYPGH